MFVVTEASARVGKASRILRYRFGGRQKEKVLGRYPEITLRIARELALRDRPTDPAGCGRRGAESAWRSCALATRTTSREPRPHLARA